MRALLLQFLKYCGVGVVNTVVGLAVILGLSHFAGWHYVAANAAGYAVGLVCSFILNRTFTFRESAAGTAAGRQWMPFIVLMLAAYAVQLGALCVMVEWLRVPEAVAQVLAIGLYTGMGFVGSRLFVFRGKQEKI